MISYAKTDTGLVRRSNQDFLFAADQPVGPLPNLFIVADGMGGHKAGDFASRYVVEHMKEYIENSDPASPVMILRKALEKTNQGLFEEAQGNPDREGMGSTLVAATIEDDMMYVANVGDSRLYLLRDSLAQITRDHSLVEEMVAREKWSGTASPTEVRRTSLPAPWESETGWRRISLKCRFLSVTVFCSALTD